MALSALCSWVRNGSPELQTALITDVSWWEESQTILRHQFLILRFDLGGILYDMRIERVGKLITSPTRRAIDSVTITRAAAFDEAFYKVNYLLFALLTHRNLVPECTVLFKLALMNELSKFSSVLRFRRIRCLDYKWAGPPARLGDLPRYFEVVNGQAPRYSVTHGNCYWFARELFHTIALRHYAFPLVASRTSPREYVLVYSEVVFHDDSWRRLDPSSTGLVFRYIQFQDNYNGGGAFYEMLVKGIRYPFGLLLIGVGVGCYAIFNADLKFPPGAVTNPHLIRGIIGISMLGFSVLLIWMFFQRIIFVLERKVERRAESILRTLDEGADPESIRATYIPYPRRFFFVGVRQPGESLAAEILSLWRKSRVTSSSTAERQLPTLWENEKQIYAPLKDEYLASFQALRQQAFFRGVRLACHLHPM
ncbi:hypothetical protein C8F01DRAFT_1301417 [Mycena amicta]|nr:hypothetical protein C8F01DRAFT_1301417 [Mycena amicta]